MRVYLNFHHHTILVECKEESVLEKIRNEFHYFRLDVPLVTPKVKIEIQHQLPPPLPSMVAAKILENCIIYRLGHRQYIDYSGEELTIWDREQNQLQIFSRNTDRLFELAFLGIHSLLGQELDLRGLCRVHALGVSLGDANLLIMLPSKGGKSTLLTHLLKNPQIRIISDDMPLVDREGRVHPFPSKISLDSPPSEGFLSELQWHEFKRQQYPTKWTASLSQLSARIDDSPMNRMTILVAGLRLSSGNSTFIQVSKWKMLKPLLEHMIMGFGLPQVLELFLRFNLSDLFKMVTHAALRSWSALAILRRSDCYHFYMGPDHTANAELLLELLNERKNS